VQCDTWSVTSFVAHICISSEICDVAKKVSGKYSFSEFGTFSHSYCNSAESFKVFLTTSGESTPLKENGISAARSDPRKLKALRYKALSYKVTGMRL
jgi:hypothetical protein